MRKHTILIIILFLLNLSIAFASIEPVSCQPSQAELFRISARINSHASILGYDNAVCVEGILGDPGNEFIWLSATDNAHASTSPTYPIGLGYDNLNCVTELTGSCQSGYDCLLTLSDLDNAHIASCVPGEAYGIAICCQPPVVCDPVCGITETCSTSGTCIPNLDFCNAENTIGNYVCFEDLDNTRGDECLDGSGSNACCVDPGNPNVWASVDSYEGSITPSGTDPQTAYVVDALTQTCESGHPGVEICGICYDCYGVPAGGSPGDSDGICPDYYVPGICGEPLYQDVDCIDQCTLENAFWGDSDGDPIRTAVQDGTVVHTVTEATGVCSALCVDIEIYEEDSILPDTLIKTYLIVN